MKDERAYGTNSVLEVAPVVRLGFKKLKLGVCDPVEPKDHAGMEGLSAVAADVAGAEVAGG